MTEMTKFSNAHKTTAQKLMAVVNVQLQVTLSFIIDLDLHFISGY